MDLRPETAPIRSLLLRIALLLPITAFAVRLVGAGALPMLALWGVVLAVPLVELGASLLRLARILPVRAWDGRWYEFDSRQVRVFEQPEHSWIAAEDVFACLGEIADDVTLERFEARYGRLGFRAPPGEKLTSFSEAALRRYLSTRTDPRSREFSRWLERDVLFAHEKRRRAAGRPEAP
jgi:hypothetical protein